MKANIENIPSYIPSLDGIRAIAVLLVVLAHSGFGNIIPGGFGVTVFFFLSGFLITTLLEKEFIKLDTVSVKHFFLRRFFRLFPALFIALCLGYFLAYFELITGGASVSGFFYQLFYLANYNKIYLWAPHTPEGLGILWSLAVEEHFYIVFPALFLLIRKFFGVRCLVLFIISLSVMVLLWRVYLIYGLDESHFRTYYSTDTRIDSILFGCLFALKFSPFLNSRKSNEIDKTFFIFMGFGALLILYSLLNRDENFRETFRYTVQGLGLMPFFYYAITLSQTKLFSWLNSKVMIKLGVYSYSIYLIHFVLTGFVIKQELTGSSFFHFLFVMFFSVVFAYTMDKFVEPYFRGLRAKYRD
jgi:peptidoglycan/LPS O-acetylase OafA/YrhL